MFLILLEAYVTKDEAFSKISLNLIVIVLRALLKFKDHPDLPFSSGTKAYDKLHKLLTSVRLVNDIKKMSPDAQTSCLEGFHSTLNHWHPKMVCFSWLGTFCR